jgi:hypothetical protein
MPSRALPHVVARDFAMAWQPWPTDYEQGQPLAMDDKASVGFDDCSCKPADKWQDKEQRWKSNKPRERPSTWPELKKTFAKANASCGANDGHNTSHENR